MPSQTPDALDIPLDPRFQERFWRVERAAWCVFAALIIVAALGLTGRGGPMSRAEAVGGAAVLDYPRVARWRNDDVLFIGLNAQGRETVVVELDHNFLDLFVIDAVQPPPSNARTTEQGMRLVFARASGENGRLRVRVTPSRPSLFERARVSVDGAPLTIRPLILP